MNKQSALGMWDMQRQRHGIAIRAVEALPADKVDAILVPGMRSAREIAIHISTLVKSCAESIAAGAISYESDAEVMKRVTTREQLITYMKDCWAAGQKAVDAATDAQLMSIVKTPWGTDFPGFVMLSIACDESLHHRGQLYTYVRLCGIEPPMVWDFEHNAAEFQPKAHAQG